MTLSPPESAPSRPPARARRRVLRIVHIIVALALGTYVYLPAHLEAIRAALDVGLAFVGVPVATVTGLWMWKGSLARRRLRRTRTDQPSMSDVTRESIGPNHDERSE